VRRIDDLGDPLGVDPRIRPAILRDLVIGLLIAGAIGAWVPRSWSVARVVT
jgi:hypothetical protein